MCYRGEANGTCGCHKWGEWGCVQALYSMGMFLRRTMPSAWNHSRRNCFAAPSGAFVHSNVMRSLFVSDVPKSNGSQATVSITVSCTRARVCVRRHVRAHAHLGVEHATRRINGQTRHVR